MIIFAVDGYYLAQVNGKASWVKERTFGDSHPYVLAYEKHEDDFFSWRGQHDLDDVTQTNLLTKTEYILEEMFTLHGALDSKVFRSKACRVNRQALDTLLERLPDRLATFASTDALGPFSIDWKLYHLYNLYCLLKYFRAGDLIGRKKQLTVDNCTLSTDDYVDLVMLSAADDPLHYWDHSDGKLDDEDYQSILEELHGDWIDELSEPSHEQVVEIQEEVRAAHDAWENRKGADVPKEVIVAKTRLSRGPLAIAQSRAPLPKRKSTHGKVDPFDKSAQKAKMLPVVPGGSPVGKGPMAKTPTKTNSPVATGKGPGSGHSGGNFRQPFIGNIAVARLLELTQAQAPVAPSGPVDGVKSETTDDWCTEQPTTGKGALASGPSGSNSVGSTPSRNSAGASKATTSSLASNAVVTRRIAKAKGSTGKTAMTTRGSRASLSGRRHE